MERCSEPDSPLQPGSRFDDPDDLTLTLGEIQRDYWKYALSVDWRVFGADLSLQVQQQYILGYQSEIIQDRIDTVWGLFIRREFFYGRLLLEMLTIYFVNDRDLLLRPKATYQLNDAFKVAVGADIFHGEIGGPLPGSFTSSDFFKTTIGSIWN